MRETFLSIFYFILILFAIFVFSLLYFTYYHNMIVNICECAYGNKYSAVVELALEKDLRVSNLSPEGTFIIHTPKNAGETVCLLKVENDIITDSEPSIR